MNEESTDTTHVQRTVFPTDTDVVELGACIGHPRCGDCGGRVDTFYRYDRPDDARCSECGEEWVIAND